MFKKLFSILLPNNDIKPPKKGKGYVGNSKFVETGKEFFEYFVKLGNLQPDEKVLDVGCGIGRMAIPLTKYLSENAIYEGFDVVPSGIDWCTKNITNKYKNYHFQVADLYNQPYNPSGHSYSVDYKFPYEDNYFDFVFLTSVFTHLLPKDMENYLKEISRVLKPNGRCLITWFLLNDESNQLMEESKSVINFNYQLPDAPAKLKNKGDEHSVAYDENFVHQLYSQYHFDLLTTKHGSWCGRDKFLSLQDIIIAKKV